VLVLFEPPMIAPNMPMTAIKTRKPARNFTPPLVNLRPHFGQNLALPATSFPHLHFRIVDSPSTILGRGARYLKSTEGQVGQNCKQRTPCTA
jgi:hypothetical protein